MQAGEVGEELVAGYYKYVRGCDFVQRNLSLDGGELDVCAIDLDNKTIYAAEVAIHLETGLAYTANGKRVNVDRLTEKFCKDIPYIRQRFPDYEYNIALWSPIVKKAVRKNNAGTSQLDEVLEAQRIILENTGIEIELVINNKFQQKLEEMKVAAGEYKAAIEDNAILRYLQITSKLDRHLEKYNRI